MPSNTAFLELLAYGDFRRGRTPRRGWVEQWPASKLLDEAERGDSDALRVLMGRMREELSVQVGKSEDGA